jgi:uridine kinase
MAIAAVVSAVLDQPAFNGIRILGVDGPSGSGKSTLARRIAAISGAPIIEIDDFVSWLNFDGWWPRCHAQVLDPLLNGDAAHYQTRDWVGDEFGTSLKEWKTVPWTSLVVLEGVTCTRAQARLTYRIWVDTPEPQRVRRGIERDGERYRELWLDWMSREREFFACDRTRMRADVIVDGSPTTPHDPATEIVVGHADRHSSTGVL